jgi:hypothetical protein
MSKKSIILLIYHRHKPLDLVDYPVLECAAYYSERRKLSLEQTVLFRLW